MFKKIISFINYCIPKKNIILFNSYPFYSDNARSLYEYIKKNRDDITDKYDIYWITDDIDSYKDMEYKDIDPVKKKSFRGIWLFLRAKYIFGTHGYYKDIMSPKRQICVNLWHGCGFKGNPEYEKGYRGNFNIVTSSIYKPIHADMFKIDEDGIIVTGLPRNDSLFNSVNSLKDIGIEKNYKKTILWLPTYRKVQYGHDGKDGDENSFGVRSILANPNELNDLLKKKNYFLIIKLHPMEEDLLIDEINNLNSSNIKVLKNKYLMSKGITIYHFMSSTDSLITDYSSVALDYMLTGGALAYIVGDFKEYKRNRGFVFENVEEMMPGPFLLNETDLFEYIDKFEEINYFYKKKRDIATKKLHKYIDGYSSKRVTEYFFDEVNNNV